MKIITFVALVTVGIAAALLIAQVQANSAAWGGYNPNAYLLVRQNVSAKSAFWRKVDRTFTFNGGYRLAITSIQAQDTSRKLNGTPVLKKGGPGFNYTQIFLESGRGDPLNYTISVFGYRY